MADSASPGTQTLTVPLDGAPAQLLADQAMTVQDLQFVMDCCRRLLAELDKPDAERDGVVPQALWSAALTSYARCFAYGKKYGLQADDVRALPLEGAVLKFHQWVLDEHGKMTSHPNNPFDVARVGAALAPPGGQRRIEGIAILSASRLLVDDVGVRQLGGLASALANMVSERAQQQQDTVLEDARKYSIDSLYNRKPLQAGPPDSAAGGAALEDD